MARRRLETPPSRSRQVITWRVMVFDDPSEPIMAERERRWAALPSRLAISQLQCLYHAPFRLAAFLERGCCGAASLAH